MRHVIQPVIVINGTNQTIYLCSVGLSSKRRKNRRKKKTEHLYESYKTSCQRSFEKVNPFRIFFSRRNRARELQSIAAKQFLLQFLYHFFLNRSTMHSFLTQKKQYRLGSRENFEEELRKEQLTILRRVSSKLYFSPGKTVTFCENN